MGIWTALLRGEISQQEAQGVCHLKNFLASIICLAYFAKINEKWSLKVTCILLLGIPNGGCWYFLMFMNKSASARIYRCSTSLGEYSGYCIFIGNGGVMVFKLVYPEEQEIEWPWVAWFG
jgi:hypothetical protein